MHWLVVGLVTWFSMTPSSTSSPQRRLLSVGKTPGLYEVASAKPTYKFVIPLPEDDLFSVYQEIAGADVVQPVVHSMVTVAISANQTVVWYDHSEDGEDEEFEQPSTLIWGDANATNGCPPNKPGCTDEEDILYLGDVFYLSSAISVPRNNATFFFDNGDMLYADYPLTISRSADADIPNTNQSLSGAIEVVDDSMLFWGKEFISPVGSDYSTATNSFDLVKMFLLSGDDDNNVTLPNGEFTTLNSGESFVLDVQLGDTFVASKDSLAHLITADTSSKYEMRWLSLLPSKAWSNEYIAPVGDETGHTNVLVYNPGTSSITIDFTTIGPDGEPIVKPIPVPPKSAALSPCVGACCESPCPGAAEPKSGARLKAPNSSDKFAAFSVSNVRAGSPPSQSNTTLGPEDTGEAFDWGFPLIPTAELTHQVQLGLGNGCRNNDCHGEAAPSSLWISPDSDADVFIDRRHIGSGYDFMEVGELESAVIRMDDMSGAIIIATEKGSGIGGSPVNFAGAWGRDPSIPSSSHASSGTSLKAGTTLLPYNVFGQSAKKGPGSTVPGATIDYEIIIENLGHIEYGPGEFVIHDDLPFGLTFVEGSMQYSSTAGSSWETLQNDEEGGSIYQLDENGLPGPERLLAHGGVHMIRYSATVDDPVEVVDYNNEVDVSFPNHEDPLELDARTVLKFEEDIETVVGVYMGTECNDGCAESLNTVMVIPDTQVTFCVNVKNTGKQPLSNVNVTIPALGVKLGDIQIPSLGVDEFKQYSYEVLVPEKGVIIPRTKSEGNPVFFNGKDIWTLQNVKSVDSAKAEAYDPSIQIVNTISLTDSCDDGEPEVAAYDGVDILHCFTVTNTGNSYLAEVAVGTPELNYTERIALLAPSESVVLQFPSPVSRDLVANATASGIPSDGSLVIEELEPQGHFSISSLTRLTHAPSSTPSAYPSAAPTVSIQPSSTPTSAPSLIPSSTPTKTPSTQPTSAPSIAPTVSASPSSVPSIIPTEKPSMTPSLVLSIDPTQEPSATPSSVASASPTRKPSTGPSFVPSTNPTQKPSTERSSLPSISPTEKPSTTPSLVPNIDPTQEPSMTPSSVASSSQTQKPIAPITNPTQKLSTEPSFLPSINPAQKLSTVPPRLPSTNPTQKPPSGLSSLPSAITMTPTSKEVVKPGDMRSVNRGGGGGDPHFKTWSSHKFDYHGECDLVLVDLPTFANGLGLRVHIRTKRRRFFSFIERAALQIGNDILEFANREEVFYNGEKPTIGTKFAGYQVNTFKKAISVRLDEKAKAKVDFVTRKSGTPYVVIDGGSTKIFEGSVGLIGDWASGKMVGRDGVTLFTDDPDSFGEEWQVRDYEPSIFQTNRAPQYPAKCNPPAYKLGNRLGDSHMRAAAEQQCSAWKEDKDECVFDVMALRDISAAEDPVSIAY